VVPPTSNFQQYSENQPVNLTMESNTRKYESEEQSGESEENQIDHDNVDNGENDNDVVADDDDDDNEVEQEKIPDVEKENNKLPMKTIKNDHINVLDGEKQPVIEETKNPGTHLRTKNKSSKGNSKLKKKNKKKKKKKGNGNKKSKKMRKKSRQPSNPKKRHRNKMRRRVNKKNNKKKQNTHPCSKDLSGLVCKLAANEANCLTNTIYKKLCCKSCSKFVNLSVGSLKS